MSERPIVDQHERTLAASDLSTTYIVEAAAGTGKTTLLVERILTIVRERQVPLAQVVAITFTEKAAGELKIKLRKQLEARAQENAPDRASYRRALLELDTMPVSTIHSFCRELIQERPVEAGVEPNFSVADQATAELLRAEVWEEWIAGEFSGECPAARPLLERGISALSSRGFSLRDLYEVLLNYREDLDALHVATLNDDALSKRFAAFREELRSELTALDACKNREDGLAKELLKIQEWLARGDTLDLMNAATWLEQKPELSKRSPGQQANWSSKEIQERAKLLRAEFETRADAVYAEFVSRWADNAVQWLKGAAEAYAQAKTLRGRLDFHDLLLLARNMLQTSRAARAFFKERFTFILVDEFQDTDPLQTEIVFFLAEQPDSFAGEWEDVELVPGKLFIVGDPKQSIYRFRRADLDLYGKVREKIEACGKCLHIRMNFRSVPDILHEVNDVFAAHMTGERNGRYEPEYVALEPYRDAVTSPQTVFLAPPDSWWDNKPNAKQQAQAEAACIAEYIREQVQQHGRTYRDIGILYSATTHLTELEHALRSREIPYQVAGGKKFIERSEVTALRTVIAALDNPFDESSVVGALRSPFFACSDEDLLVQRWDGDGFNYLRCDGALPHVEECLALLRELHRQKARRAPSETIADLFARAKGLQIYALKPHGDGRVANLLKLLDMARALENDAGSSFHALARRLAKLEDTRAAEDDSATAETGDNVVQLLTFHKAKGLEFPLVMLFRLGHVNNRPEGPLIARGTKALEFSARKGFATAGYLAASEDDHDREACEHMRLLYVAMTRAREQLVIPAYWCDATKGFYKLLRTRYTSLGQMPETGHTRFTVHDSSRYSLDVPPTEALKIELDMPENDPRVGASIAAKAGWEQQRRVAVEQLNRSRAFATPSRSSSLGISANGHGVNRDAAKFGSYVHRLLERVTLPDGANLGRICLSSAEEFGIRENRIQEGCDLVRAALKSDLFQRAYRAEALYREVPFADVQDGVLWEGVIDLMFVEQDQLIIVDFKTDAISTNELPDSAQHYAAQLHAYRRAMEKIAGKPVAELLLYYLRPNTTVAVPPLKVTV